MEKKVLNYIKKSVWKDNTKNDIVFEIAQNYVNSLSSNLLKKNILHRVSGQSGSGKTTQIMKSFHQILDARNIEICHLAVRNFASLHPAYEVFKKKYGTKLLREKTNGFALKCLVYSLKLLMQKGYFIVFEMTLLEKVFEKYVLYLARENNYKIKFHMLAVSPKISNFFIEKRNKLSANLYEEERITLKKSLNYFNKVLPKSFKFLIRQKKFKASIIIWNAFDISPSFYGALQKSKKIFFKQRQLEKKFLHNEKELCQAKTNFYEKYELF